MTRRETKRLLLWVLNRGPMLLHTVDRLATAPQGANTWLCVREPWRTLDTLLGRNWFADFARRPGDRAAFLVRASEARGGLLRHAV